MFKNKANEYKEKYQMRASVCLVVLIEPVKFLIDQKIQKIQNETKIRCYEQELY